MKIAVSSTGKDLASNVDPRFGRCSSFVVVDSDSGEHESIPNGSAGAMGGAGIVAAQLVAKEGVEVVLTGNVGPNAFNTLKAAGISVVTGVKGTVEEAVKGYRNGKYLVTREPTVDGHHGSDGGRSGGMGRQ